MKTAADIHARNHDIAPGQTPDADPRSPDTGKSRPGHRALKSRIAAHSNRPIPFPGLHNGFVRIGSNGSSADCAAHRYRMIFGQGTH